ncbi:MAG TPA: YbhN family protein [Geodermatophilus sp.]|nr:YbhN family protein [Geodermatophilus sp.]
MTPPTIGRPPRTALRRALTGRVARGVLTVAVVVAVFAGVLPQLTDYGEAWALVTATSGTETAAIAVLAAVSVFSYAPVWMAAVPGLTLGRAVLADQASTAISNTVPVGFAFGVGTVAAMYHSFGFSAAMIARAVALTGLWNNLVKLATPAVALAGLAVVSDTTPVLTLAAGLGSATLLVVAGALLAVVTHERAAAVLSRSAERAAGAVLRPFGRPAPSGWVARVERFRVDSLDLLQHRWLSLTLTTVVNQAVLFVLLLVCLRAVGGAEADVHWLVVLAVFSVTRLVTAVPITPGAVGVAELSYVAGLTAVGVASAAAAGTVLVFRFLTWFLPIPLGVVAWLLWRRGVGRAPAAAGQAAG